MKTFTAPTRDEKETLQSLKLNELNNRLKRIVQSTRSLASCSSFDQTIQQILEEFAQNMGSRGGSIYLVKNGSLVLQTALDHGHAEPVISLPPPAASVFGRAIDRKSPILMQNIAMEKDINPCGWTKCQNGSLLAFPFFDNQEQLIGMISLHNKDCPPFTLQDMEIGSILAAHSCEIIKAGLYMEALAQSEAKYRDLTENIRDVSLFTLDATGIVTYISPSVQSVTGYRQEDFLGKDYRNNFLAEESVCLTDSFARNSQGMTSRGICGLRTPDGELRWIRISSWPIWKKNCFAGSQGTLTDMTEIKIVQEKIENNIQEMATVNNLGREIGQNLSVDHIVDVAMNHLATAVKTDAVMFFMADGNRLTFKKSLPENVFGDETLLPDHHLGTCLCGLAAMKHQALYSTNIHIDPRCVFDECKLAGFYSLSALPLIQANELIGIILVGSKTRRDFEEQSAFLEAISHEIAIGLHNALLYEKAQADAIELQTRLRHIQDMEHEKERLMIQLQHAQKMEAIGTLAGGIAHDFNNILTPIIMGTEMAQRYVGADSPASAMIEKTLTAAGRARDLVQHILTFSRQNDIHIRPLRIGPIIRETIKMARAILPATIEIQQDLKPENDLVRANPTQVHQVVMNLITNAAHAMRISGGKLSISLKNQSVNGFGAYKAKGIQPGNYICLCVGDTGHGMDQITLEQIFDPFFTTKERGEGTGLGLSIIHGIVKNCDGMIYADSKIGKGTVFTVFLPVINQPHEEKSSESIDIPTGHERILLIDDEPFIVEIVSAMLQDIGYRVDGRNDAEEALHVFSLHPENYDLIITDMTMPGMTGDRLAMKILQIRSDIPIMMCTGFSEHMTPEKANEIGIKALLMKPVAIGELATTIRNVIRHSDLTKI